nr:MAG TPA: hypothetical protein [Caudoviricetes sp.]DAU12940.1 MAG TPA: hypothetical protein [Caudoviricetes sp.]DAX39087.1 MAG TPA: hypothetical protein [Caudoviricetes sp.]
MVLVRTRVNTGRNFKQEILFSCIRFPTQNL